MRVWEVEDNRSIPSDLVHEQDFILRLRRLHRLGTPHLVLNLALNAMETVAKSRRLFEDMQERLREFAKVTDGVYAEMSNGDVFIVWEETSDAQILSSRILAAVSPDGRHIGGEHGVDKDKVLLSYHMPQDYTLLRERANYYIEVVRAASLATNHTPADALKGIPTNGPLTAWGVDQIGKLLGDIDLDRYTRNQSIYQRAPDGKFAPLFEEQFLSFEDLRRERFPKLDIITPEHLFLALCEILDQRLLAGLIENDRAIAGKSVYFNISVVTIIGSLFAQFARHVPATQHNSVGFELNRGDLLQDFTMTLGAIEVLRHEGFRVAIDGITPNMLDYLNLANFDVHHIKINVSKERADQLSNPAFRKALSKIPSSKIIFYRCDNEAALAKGIELGVSHFQGWYIDDLLAKKA